MNECYNIVVAVKGGDCCRLNECYNIVVVVKVATAVRGGSRSANSDPGLVLGVVGSRKTGSRARPRRDFFS